MKNFLLISLIMIASMGFSQRPMNTSVDFKNGVLFSSDISPSVIATSQNDYAPTGFGTASVVRLSASAASNITGLAGGSDGRTIILLNVGAEDITLKDESASSVAANRFALTADLVLSTDEFAIIWYDSTSSRWRLISS